MSETQMTIYCTICIYIFSLSFLQWPIFTVNVIFHYSCPLFRCWVRLCRWKNRHVRFYDKIPATICSRFENRVCFSLRDWGQKCWLLKPELAQCQQSFEVPRWLWFVNVVKVRKNTRYRFNCLINELKYAKCSRLRQVLLQVINSLIDHAPNTTDRIHIRNECIGQLLATSLWS